MVWAWSAILGVMAVMVLASIALEHALLLVVDSSTNTPPPAMGGGHAAYSACRRFVTDSLDTPATAKFASRFGEDTKVRKIFKPNSPVAYEVASHVDAENRFGATVRTRFVCDVAWLSVENRWLLLGLQTSPWSQAP